MTPEQRFNKAFPRGKAFIPVIHIQTDEQALENASIAFGEGADGIALIDHNRRRVEFLLDIYRSIQEKYPAKPILLNFLTTRDHAGAVLHLTPHSVTGVWMDDGGFREDAADPVRSARELHGRRATEKRLYQGLLFGGVAFKYQRPVSDPARAAKLMMPYIDVITTSGPETGHPPSLEKIRAIRQETGSHPLANASGFTLANVEPYIPYLNVGLIATAITEARTELLIRNYVRTMARMWGA